MGLVSDVHNCGVFGTLHAYVFLGTEARKKCQEFGSSLWQVLDGEPEWDSIIDRIPYEQRHLWLNGEIGGHCLGNDSKDVILNSRKASKVIPKHLWSIPTAKQNLLMVFSPRHHWKVIGEELDKPFFYLVMKNRWTCSRHVCQM